MGPDSATTITATWNASKIKVHQLHQTYVLKMHVMEDIIYHHVESFFEGVPLWSLCTLYELVWQVTGTVVGNQISVVGNWD